LKAISTATARSPVRRAALAAFVAALAIGLAACGGSHSSGTSADPATVTPATAPVFLGAEVRPGGHLKEAALSTGQKLTHRNNPYAGLVGALRTPGSPSLSYSHDVAPWLGPKAGAFVSSEAGAESLAQLLLAGAGQVASFPFSGTGSGTRGAIVMDTSDPSAAQSFLGARAAAAGAHATSYRGVSYRVTANGLAFALVKRFAVIGSDGVVREVIDTSAGGPSLAQSPDYSKLLAGAPGEALAHLYVAGVPGSHGPSAGAGAAGAVLGLIAPGGTTLTSVVPGASSLTVALDAIPAAGASGLLEAAPQGAQALGELPGESWLALGIGNAHARLGAAVLRLGSLLGLALGSSSEGPAGGLGSLLKALFKPLEALAATTPAAQSDFASWMGPVGVFAGGANVLELKAGVVISSTDAARSAAAVDKLAAELRSGGASTQPLSLPGTEAAVSVRLQGLPLPVVIAAGHDPAGKPKFVVGLGQASVSAALSPPSTLSGSPSAKAAAGALGEGIEPSLILAVPTLVSLLEGLGLTEGSGISGLTPYLHAVTTVSGGARSLGGGVERVKVVLGLAPAAG
jgi:hypothetical protein